MPRGRASRKRTAPRDSRPTEPAKSVRREWPSASPWAAAAVIVLAGAAAYSNSLHGALGFDDPPSIAHNESIRSLWRVDKVLLPVEKLDYYRPVLNLSLALCYGVGGLHVLPYHVLNLGLHLAASLTLFGLVRRSMLLSPPAGGFCEASTPVALAAALLWMLHPLQTESVTYVVQRCEAMFGLFCLLTLYCVLRGATSPRAWRWYGGAAAACALGMGSKEAMAVTPLLVLLYDRIFLASSLREAFRQRWGLYAALALTWGILLPMVLVSDLGQSERAADPVTIWEYARTQFGVVVHYLRLSVWPDALCLDYQWPVAQTAWGIVFPAVLIGVLLAAVLWALWRWPKGGFLGAGFFATLAPSSSVIPIPDLAFEHRMYLPLAPLVVALVLGVYVANRKLVSRRPSLRPAARLSSVCLVAGIAAVLGILTHLRNDDYRSELRIWQDTVAQAPNNYRAHNNLGRALAQDGRTAEAIGHYQKALEINPEYAETNFNFGMLLVQLGQGEAAVPLLKQVLAVRPSDLEAHLNLGVALAQQNRVDEAIGHYQKVLEIDPRFAPAHNNLGNMLLRLGRVDRAVLHYQAAVAIDPQDAEYQHNLSVGLLELAKTRKATPSKPAEK